MRSVYNLVRIANATVFLQAAIMDSNLTFKCGGTLLNNRHILTVAHCVQKNTPATLLVRLGDTNLRSSVRRNVWQSGG